MKKSFFLKGNKIILRQIDVEDMKKLSKLISCWVNDGTITYYMFTGQTPYNSSQIFDDFKKLIESGHNVIFLVLEKKTEKPIGYAGLYEINSIARKAEYRILIGDRNFWGKGLGTEITELLIYYGFDRLNLHRIYLGFTANNMSAKRAYEKAGFKCEGVLKDDIYRNSRYYDSVRMAILREEYYKHLHKIYDKKFSLNK